MLFFPMNSPTSFESPNPNSRTPATPLFLNHFHSPKSAHYRNPHKTHHFHTLQKNMGV